jgi:predicted ABC-type transport system involved in lysophospholipase L1 biosynthesis ATPase subunit
MFAERVGAGTTVLAVSHDDRLNQRADRLIEVVDGRTAVPSP